MSFHQFALFQAAESRFGKFFYLEPKDHIMWLFDFVQCYVHLEQKVVDKNKEDIDKGYLNKKDWDLYYDPSKIIEIFANLGNILKDDWKGMAQWQVGEAVFNIPFEQKKKYQNALKDWNEESNTEGNVIKRIFNAMSAKSHQTWNLVRDNANSGWYYRTFARDTGIKNNSYFLRPYTDKDGEKYFYTVQQQVCEEKEVIHAM
mgnify:FL=1|jgi:hypothetical protein